MTNVLVLGLTLPKDLDVIYYTETHLKKMVLLRLTIVTGLRSHSSQ